VFVLVFLLGLQFWGITRAFLVLFLVGFFFNFIIWRVNSVFFCFFSSNLIIHYFIYLELDFIIFFDLFSIRLSPTHYLSDGFDGLTCVESSCFSIYFFQFDPPTLYWLRIGLHNLFWFTFYQVIQSHDSGYRLDTWTRVDSSCLFFGFF